MKIFWRFFLVLLSSTLLFGCQTIEHRSQIAKVPIRGVATKLVTTVFYPQGAGPFPVAILNHGTPAGEKGRRAMGQWAPAEPVNALVDRGYVVAIPMRRGFGATGGSYNGGIGGCGNPKFYRGSLGAAEDILATVEYVKTLPSVDGSRILLIGHSAGGIASMAAASMQPDGVRAVMNFSGGRGSGRLNSKRGVPCFPERMANAIGRYAQTIDAPVLWYYVEDDTFFGPEVVRSWFESFQKNGGKGELVFHPGSALSDGHQFIKESGSSKDWGPVLDKFLATVDF